MPIAIETIENQRQQLGYPHVFYPAFSRDDAIAQIGKMPNLAKARIIEVSQTHWERIMNGYFDGWLRTPELPTMPTVITTDGQSVPAGGSYMNTVDTVIGNRKRHLKRY